MLSFNILAVVAMNSVVSFSSTRSSTPVTGSSDSYTMRCRVPVSCIRSPLISVTAPFAKTDGELREVLGGGEGGYLAAVS